MSNLDELQSILSDLSKQYGNFTDAINPLPSELEKTDNLNSESATSEINSETLSVSDLQLNPQRATNNQLPPQRGISTSEVSSYISSSQPLRAAIPATPSSIATYPTSRTQTSMYPYFYSQLPYQQQLPSNQLNNPRPQDRGFPSENSIGLYDSTARANREPKFSSQISNNFTSATNPVQPKISSYFVSQQAQQQQSLNSYLAEKNSYSTSSYANTTPWNSEINTSSPNPLYNASSNSSARFAPTTQLFLNQPIFPQSYQPQQTQRNTNSLQGSKANSSIRASESSSKSSVKNKRIILGDDDILRLTRLIPKSSQVVKKCLESPQNMEYLTEVELKTIAIYLRQRYSLSAITPNVSKKHLIQIISFVIGVDDVGKNTDIYTQQQNHNPSYGLDKSSLPGLNTRNMQLPTDNELQLFNAQYKPIPFLKSITRLWCQKIPYKVVLPAKVSYYSHSFTAMIPLALFDTSIPSSGNRRLVHISIFSLDTKQMLEASVLNQAIQLKIDGNYVVLSKKQTMPGIQYFDITSFVEKALANRSDSHLTIIISVPTKCARQDIMAIHSLVHQSIDEITAKVYSQTIMQLQRHAKKPLHITIPTKLDDVEKALMNFAANFKDTAPTTTKSALEDDDIEMGDQIISFICPLSLKKIRHPSKGKNCKHAQCFDAQNYITCNEGNIKWKCTVCNQELPFSEMIIDIKFKNYLNDYPDLERCLIHSDGSTAPLPQDDIKSRTSTPAISELTDNDRPPKRTISEVIELSDESDEEIERSSRLKTNSNSNASKHPKISSLSSSDPNAGPEVIVLD
ncbi:hypothetical protein K7432_002440 [Basidiobolus ranarum]|uniref:SP-RING-type domain-containing protein n=1 Tax=Basidiobolus ranarum TaxID=34480 RepID=A0ABR2X1I9_9FUNG